MWRAARGPVSVARRTDGRWGPAVRSTTRTGPSHGPGIRTTNSSPTASAWPASPDVVVGLHACGAASDAIFDAAVAIDARAANEVPSTKGVI